jgi:glycosyltransferase involved in cell wall biosynthesis
VSPIPGALPRRRVGWASPLPPQRSGIADYSARLVPALAERLEIELLAEPGQRPERALAERFAVRPLAGLPGLAAERGYDAVVYQMGNHPGFHGGILGALLRHPGIVVLHEAVLHHMVRELTLSAGDPDGYAEAMRYAYGPTGRALALRAIATGVPLDPWRYPLFERTVDAARAVVVHNRSTRDRVLAARPAARVEVIPHFVELDELERGAAAGLGSDPRAARAALGLPPDALVVATFGYLTAAKRLDACLAAFARLRAERPEAVFLLAGEAAPDLDLERRLAGAAGGAGAGVIPLGHLPLDRFLAAMAATDVALNLRHPTGGETSGTLMRLLALGKAVVVTDAGAFAEIPDGCVAKVAPDAFEAELLAVVLGRLAGDPALRAALGGAARRWVAARCALPAVAAAYAELIEEVASEDFQSAPVVPPLAPYPPEDLLAELLRHTGAELADLVPPGSESATAEAEAAAGVARAVVDLGLDGPFR